jgi:hypothetical protein
MYTIRFDKEMLNITIFNLYPGSELISPLYFSTGTCYVSPSQQAGTGSIIDASFRMDYEKEFNGLLLYKLQRKHTTRTGNISIASINDKARNVYLLVSWDIRDQIHDFHVRLLECDDNFTWDEDKLWSFYKGYDNQFYVDYKSNAIKWLTNDDAVVVTKHKVKYESNYELNILISDGTKNYKVNKPIQIDSRRLVLLLSMLTVLIYTVSILIRPSVKLIIHNQCSNIDLISPAYTTNYSSECYRTPDHEVFAGNTMSSSFTIGSDDVFYGILIYKLQRRQLQGSIEIDEIASSTVHLLVVWRATEPKELYADVMLVEHDKGFDWNNNKLNELYYRSTNQFRLRHNFAIETWLLDDNTSLMTTFEILNGQILRLTISEAKKDSNGRVPAHIDLER